MAGEVKFDIGVITIISEETQALRDWLSAHDNFRSLRADDGNWFYTGEVPVTGRSPLRVVGIQATRQGQLAAYEALSSLRSFGSPELLVLVGIAGGIHKDVQVGDVVVAEAIIDYSPVATTEQGPRHRGITWNVNGDLLKTINHFFSGGDDPRPVVAGARAASKGTTTFSMLHGPIGTGNAVVKWAEDPNRIWLSEVNDKTLALETEAAAVSSYFHEHASSNNLVGYLVIRGISDHADREKTDEWKSAASQNAFIALTEMLPTIRDLLGDL